MKSTLVEPVKFQESLEKGDTVEIYHLDMKVMGIVEDIRGTIYVVKVGVKPQQFFHRQRGDLRKVFPFELFGFKIFQEIKFRVGKAFRYGFILGKEDSRNLLVWTPRGTYYNVHPSYVVKTSK